PLRTARVSDAWRGAQPAKRGIGQGRDGRPECLLVREVRNGERVAGTLHLVDVRLDEDAIGRRRWIGGDSATREQDGGACNDAERAKRVREDQPGLTSARRDPPSARGQGRAR